MTMKILNYARRVENPISIEGQDIGILGVNTESHDFRRQNKRGNYVKRSGPVRQRYGPVRHLSKFRVQKD
jgi:hypothetical protein